MSGLSANCVVDASVGIKLFLPEEYSEEVQKLFEQRLVQPASEICVPDLFFIECANVLWKKIRRAEYDAGRAASDLADLKELRLPSISTSELMERALQIACAHDISTYDACYVALAELRGVPLVTADDRLAAKLAGTSHEIIALCQAA